MVDAGHTGPSAGPFGHPGRPTSSAAALLSYDIPHHAPWGWRVSLYTWTTSIAAGAFVLAILLALTGSLAWSDDVVRWVAPLSALAMLGVTGVLLIWDLKHPSRLYFIFTKHQWQSWIVRGSFIIAAYGGMVTLYLWLLIAAERRYSVSVRRVQDGCSPVAPRMILGLTVAVVALAATAFGFLLPATG